MSKIPHKIDNVHTDIVKHENYKKLDLSIKIQFEECVRVKNKDNNQYSRKLWEHLFQEKELPFG